jgi:hypothetical protein
MTTPRLNLSGLQIRLALRRFGWSNSVALLLCATGTLVWLLQIPYLATAVEVQRASLALARKSLQSATSQPSSPQRQLGEERLAAFYDNLGEKRYAEQQVKTLFAIASKNNLSLSQAEYKFGYDKNGRFHTYHIRLPVKGSYATIRQFCEQTLLTIPFASLDQMSFKRDAITSRRLEAQLDFTLFLGNAAKPTLPLIVIDAKSPVR